MTTSEYAYKTPAESQILAAAPELLRELEAAHRILGHAFNLITAEQKDELKRLVELGGLKGEESITRYFERRDIIKKAGQLVRHAIPPKPVEDDLDDDEDRIPY